MYTELLGKVKRIKPSALTDSDILGFFEEAVTLICEGNNDYANGKYLDNVLLYYALAQISLYCGDLAEYSNYFVLYNNAATEFRRRSFSNSESDNDNLKYKNMW